MNRIEKIALVGVGGRVGTYITKHLLLNGKHTVTAITRPDSTSTVPKACKIAQVDYDDHSSLVSALKGHDALIISLSRSSAGQQEKLINAAAAAGVRWIMPNEYGIDTIDERLADVSLGPVLKEIRDKIENLGMNWVSLVCGFWYEFSLGGGVERYGFDFKKNRVLFFDDGRTSMDTSTWDQCGRAVASLFALKVLPDDENDSAPCLVNFANRFCYISSFTLSQKDMFEAVKRVKGETDNDWVIEYKPSQSIFEEAKEEIKQGKDEGLVKELYSRLFYPNGGGCYSSTRTLHNQVLGLPVEDLDAATKRAIQFGEKGAIEI